MQNNYWDLSQDLSARRHGYHKIGMYKDIVAAAEYSGNFSESDQSTYQKRQQSLVILITQTKFK